MPPGFRTLAGILVLAAALRFWGLTHGLPFTMGRPDEREALAHTIAFSGGNLDPGWLVYPNPFFWLLWGWISLVLAAGRVLDPTLPDYATLLRERMPDAILIGRVLSALVGTATVAVVWSLGRRVGGASAAAVAATLTAVCFLHVRDSHALKADVFLTAVVPLVLARIARWVADPTPVKAIACGTAVGLATSIKYPGMLLLASVWHGERIARPGSGWRRLVPGPSTLAATLVALAVFLACNPFLVSDLVRLEEIATFMIVAAYGQRAEPLSGVATGPLELAWRWLAGRSFAYHSTVSLRYGFGLAMAVLAPLLILGGLRRQGPVFLRLAAGFCIAYTIAIGLSQVTQSRYVTPMLPLLAMLAGDAVARLARRAAAPRTRALVALLATAILGAEPLASSIAYDRIAARTDTRVLAQRWMAEHLPRGAVVARLGSGIFPIADPELPPGLVAAPLPPGSTALDAFGVGWVVVHEHPLPFSRPDPAQMARLAPRLTLLVTFDPFRDGPSGVFEELDAHYIPIGRFSGVERPGPIVRIYRWESTASGQPPQHPGQGGGGDLVPGRVRMLDVQEESAARTPEGG